MPSSDDVFERAMVKAFGSEGGLSDHPDDHGGLTNYGISLRYLRNLGADRGGDIDLDGDVDAEDVLKARPADAKRLFKRDFWQASGAEDFASRLPDLACDHFDFAIVRGPANAIRALQSALNYFGADVVVDGGYGDETHGALLHFLSSYASLGAKALLSEVRRQHAIQFAKIVKRDRSQLPFLLGWELRALD